MVKCETVRDIFPVKPRHEDPKEIETLEDCITITIIVLNY